MTIRAHHLLCMRYFNGKGYSKEFVSNFYTVLSELKNNPAIKIVNSPDVICSSCPHNIKGRCVKKGPDFENEVKEKDALVIAILGLRLEQKISFKEATMIVSSKLPDVKEVCKECEWKAY